MDLISGGTLANRGTLRATEDLSATAGLVVNGGLMEAVGRLSVLAADSVINTRGGLLTGRDVDVTALSGDLINERTVTAFTAQASGLTFTHSLVDAAARIEAAGDLALSAGRDLYNVGSVLGAGGAMDLSAGRHLVIAAAEDRQSSVARTPRTRRTSEHVTQLGAEVSAGGSLAMVAGGDLAVIASQVKAGGDALLLAGGDATLAAAADVSHTDYRYKGSSKKIHRETLSVRQQQTEVQAGGNLTVAAGQDLTVVASAAQAGEEAYLYAGGELALLAAANQDYTLYDKKKKGSFGSKKTRRDEVTTVTQVGSQVSAGTDLTLESGGDQTYQVAKLASLGDLTLESGGEIAFEGVKDLKQESHEKSSSSWAWTSAKGKGKTDETLRQSELVAGGELAIRAAGRISIDVKEVNAQTVTQTIDALVQAEPQLAWLKEMEARGDVDWQRVKEVHDSFKYSHSGLGAGLALVIAIVVTVLTWGAASGAVATLTNAAVGTASNAALTAAATSAMSNMAINTINSGGDLGEALELSLSEDALKGYATSAIVAGITAGYIDKAFGAKTNAATGTASGFDLNTVAGVGRFAAYQGTRAVVSAGVGTAINGGSFSDNLAQALTSAAVHTVSAAAFNQVGNLGLENGSIEKIAAKALVGGLISQAATGDFATGALAAGANETLVHHLAELVDHDPELLSMASQLVGAVSSAVSEGDPQLAADIANYDTQYNHELHKDAGTVAEQALDHCKSRPEQCDLRFVGLTTEDVLAAMEAEAQHGIGFEEVKPEALAFVNDYMFTLSPGLRDVLYIPTASEQQRLDFIERAELVGAGASVVGGLAGAVKNSGTISGWIASLLNKGNVAQGVAEGLSFTRSQLQHAFKHAKDFGISGNANNKTLSEFGSALQSHVDAAGTRAIKGTYRGNPVTHHVDPSTGLNVIRDSSGNFLSGWRLSPQQLEHVLTTGKLGGG
ncbi:DUF637 domain-containing protein [Pseudothauera rhizosphaerae]|uniref:Hemagglutinin n=1 Tax=Pseudothauera rhizosphaerae TaxID=2565932 RepID=A0A4S4ATZ7_9RHOO|nr:DUF637 domain-containing protein [Pseudothauera rhizosphaerae]THF63407.1 hemagglutinin [Pseudothauera rhizosphaerae]